MSSTKPLAASTIERLARMLRSRREEIAEAAESFHEEVEEAVASADLSDLLDDEEPSGNEAHDVLMLAVNADNNLAAVDAALAKIDAGTYGFCEDCGERIPVARLEAIPATPVCVDCSRERASHPS